MDKLFKLLNYKLVIKNDYNKDIFFLDNPNIENVKEAFLFSQNIISNNGKIIFQEYIIGEIIDIHTYICDKNIYSNIEYYNYEENKLLGNENNNIIVSDEIDICKDYNKFNKII